MRFRAYIDIDYWSEKLLAIFNAIYTLTIFLTMCPFIAYTYDQTFTILSVSLVITLIFLLIFIYYLTFDHIEIDEGYLRFKWFTGERSVKVEGILSFYHLGELGAVAPLYKVDRPRVSMTLCILVGTSLTVIPTLFKFSWILGAVFSVLIIITALSTLLPTNIGRKVFCGFVFMDAGYIIDTLIILRLKIDVISLSSLIITALILIFAFLLGYYLCSLRKWIYDYLIIKVVMNDKERTIIINGKVREIDRFKEALIDVMKNVKVAWEAGIGMGDES